MRNVAFIKFSKITCHLIFNSIVSISEGRAFVPQKQTTNLSPEMLTVM